jgi:hypothetical protein
MGATAGTALKMTAAEGETHYTKLLLPPTGGQLPRPGTVQENSIDENRVLSEAVPRTESQSLLLENRGHQIVNLGMFKGGPS